MKAAILGGTFNPIHYGHLFVAEEVRSSLGYDTVIFVPANKPVHKDALPVIEPAHRLQMLRLALMGSPHFLLDDCEIRHGGPSYSIRTISGLVASHGISGRPGFIIGDDLVSGYGEWMEAERLAEETELIVARRKSEEPIPFSYPHRSIMNAMLPISSSDIRRRIYEGRNARFLLPDAVIAYIAANHLYERD
jgi:nicotinate-nucleotide adenylyltransferase